MNTIKSFGLAGIAAAALLAFPAFATPVTCPAGFQGSPTCIRTTGGDGSNSALQNYLGPAGSPNSIFSSGPGVDVYNQQVQTPFWAANATSGSVATVLLQLTSNQNNFTYGIFDPTDPGNKLALFTDANNGSQALLSVYVSGGYAVNNGAIHHFGTTNHFGYYLELSNGTIFYSLPTLNSNGDTRMVAFEGTDGPNQSVVMPGVGGTLLQGGPFTSNEFIQGWEDGTDFDYQDFVVLVADVHPVPEPAALGVFGLGVLLIGGFVALRRRREGMA